MALRPAIYLVIAAVTAALQLVAVFAVASTHYFVSHSSDAYDVFADVKITIRGIDADVLLVGDSAVGSGVDPAVIKRDTGLSAYNLGVTITAFAHDPDFLIDHYLAENKQPRIIAFYLSPTTHIGDPQVQAYETGGMMLRHGGPERIASYFLLSPGRLLEYAHQVLTIALSSDWSDVKYRRIVRSLTENAGFIPIEDTAEEAATYGHIKDYAIFCAQETRHRPPDEAAIAHFRQKYTRPGTTVMILVAPLADCDRSADYYAAEFDGLADTVMPPLPHELFIPDFWRVHLKKQGAELNSHIVGEVLLDWAVAHGVVDFGKPG
jgi:hypothetical protein